MIDQPSKREQRTKDEELARLHEEAAEGHEWRREALKFRADEHHAFLAAGYYQTLAELGLQALREIQERISGPDLGPMLAEAAKDTDLHRMLHEYFTSVEAISEFDPERPSEYAFLEPVKKEGHVLTPRQVQAVRRRFSLATPGPYYFTTDSDYDEFRGQSYVWPTELLSKGTSVKPHSTPDNPRSMRPAEIANLSESNTGWQDAHFLANSWSDVRDLLRTVENLQAQKEAAIKAGMRLATQLGEARSAQKEPSLSEQESWRDPNYSDRCNRSHPKGWCGASDCMNYGEPEAPKGG